MCISNSLNYNNTCNYTLPSRRCDFIDVTHNAPKCVYFLKDFQNFLELHPKFSPTGDRLLDLRLARLLGRARGAQHGPRSPQSSTWIDANAHRPW
jgi:hypothetical protein